jgi:hypothetical protein
MLMMKLLSSFRVKREREGVFYHFSVFWTEHELLLVEREEGRSAGWTQPSSSERSQIHGNSTQTTDVLLTMHTIHLVLIAFNSMWLRRLII